MSTIAFTFTGGIDSTVLTYYILRECAKIEAPYKVRLIACNYGQANWLVTVSLLRLHVEHLQRLYGADTDFDVVSLDVTLPSWSTAGGLHRSGFKPPSTSPKDFDYSRQEKTYDYCLIDGRNAFLFLHMLSYCSHKRIPVLYTGHQYEPLEWQNYDSYRHRTEDFGPQFLDRMNLLQEVGFQNRVRLEAPFVLGRVSKSEIIDLGLELNIDLARETYSCQFAPKCNRCDNCVNRANTFKKLGLADG